MFVILRGLLAAFFFPLLYQKKVPCTPRFKGTAKFINVLRQELQLNEGTLIMYSSLRPSIV